MTRTRVKPVRIAVGHDPSGLSREQKAFNWLINQIERRRATLAAWEIAIPAYRKSHLRDLVPVVEAAEDLKAPI